MPTFQDTPLWMRTLASRADDDASAARDRLRDAYLAMRGRAASIAASVAADLPEFTLHDESHFDALWEMASLVAPEEVHVTPTEAFVLGGAFLIHDLGMGIAAFPHGVDELRARPLWKDTVALILRRAIGSAPTTAEVEDAPDAVQRAALRSVLRALHAQQAEAIATSPWHAAAGTDQFLIENDDLRSTYGHLIGRIAHSHWWPSARLADEFLALLGAPAWTSPACPISWTLDPLKIAAIFRAADAIHLDARRAPRFLRTLRRPTGISEHHWAFQEKLNLPIVERDRVVFTSATPFSLVEAGAWWTCFDVLRHVDRYLVEIDSVLTTASRPRLAARGVAALESPRHLAQRIPTSGWEPIDTEIHISDVAHLVRTLGGEELYGHNAPVALRELLQNAGDAVRARRLVEGRQGDFGEITVSLRQRQEQWWLEVQDNGVGMSTTVLTEMLLDFGRSFWTSDLVAEELPGLMGAGFAPTGQYGIGFFSVLMLGDQISVTSRPYSAALSDTRVLAFTEGVSARPLLRPADETEYMPDGGTRVAIALRRAPTEPDGLLWRWGREPWKLADLTRHIAPAFDVSVTADDAEASEVAVVGSDWLAVEPPDLISRTYAPIYIEETRVEDLLEIAGHMRVLQEEDGRVVGRALLHPMSTYAARFGVSNAGAVTVGGLHAVELDAIAGVLDGEVQRAARDIAFPIVTTPVLSAWATEQAKLLAGRIEAGALEASAAAVVIQCSGDPGALRFCETNHGWLTTVEFAEWVADTTELNVLFGADIPTERARGSEIRLYPNVIWLPATYSLIRASYDADLPEWPENLHFVYPDEYRAGHGPDAPLPEWIWTYRNSPIGLAISQLAACWGVPERVLLEASTFRFARDGRHEAASRDGAPFRVDLAAVIRRP